MQIRNPGQEKKRVKNITHDVVRMDQK